MGRPKWMIKRDEKRAKEAILAHIETLKSEIEIAIEELLNTVNKIKDNEQREIITLEINNEIEYFKNTLKQAPGFCSTVKQLQDIYELIHMNIVNLTKALSCAYIDESKKAK